MPFQMKGDGTHLSITHVLEIQYHIDINKQFDFISIVGGKSVNEPFNINEILVRSAKLYFYDCFVDLSALSGQWNTIQLKQCHCTGELNQCEIECLDNFAGL
ncbi:Hypothetical_protein [Hexamita inflata]|uniref:Hypothetical_protein n=1 Tax=Hexamita inflata TaxID=28002 RepID=A0ABP1GJ31_9EUKA